MKLIFWRLSFAVLLNLAGCAADVSHGSPSTPVNPLSRIDAWLKTDVDALVLYGASLRQENATELTADAESLNKTYSARPNEANRLRLGIFLALAPSPHGDRGRALALLDVPPNEANGRGRNHPVAAMLVPLLQDIRRLDDGQRDSQQKLRDEQKRGDALQQKLDAIRDIEKNMSERSPGKTP